MAKRAGRVTRWLAIVLVLALALWNVDLDPASAQAPNVQGSDAQVPTDEAPRGFVAGEILVKFRPGTPGQTAAEAHRQNDGQVREVIPRIDVHVVRVPTGQEAARVATYARNPTVLFAEQNGFYQAISHPWVTAPNDPRAGDQWQYNNTGQAGGTVNADINAFEAWHVTRGSASVPIAILDTGIDQNHEDLQSNIAQNKNFTDSPTADDRYGHGTHVAGSAAAATHNGRGVAGTCPGCALYNVKVLGDRGGGQWDWIANGIVWAADNGAKVISMSLGGAYDSNTVRLAVEYAWGKGAVLTAAAGNDGVNTRFYPAAYDKVIAVGATTRTDTKASFSNYGADWVDVAAPGADILSTAPNHSNTLWRRGVTYGTISGTSMATPHVAGVAGLVWSTSLCGVADVSVHPPVRSLGDRLAQGTAGRYTSAMAKRLLPLPADLWAMVPGPSPSAAARAVRTSVANVQSKAQQANVPTTDPNGFANHSRAGWSRSRPGWGGCCGVDRRTRTTRPRRCAVSSTSGGRRCGPLTAWRASSRPTTWPSAPCGRRWTCLSFVDTSSLGDQRLAPARFEADRAQVAQGGMPSLPIIEHLDPLEDGESRGSARWPALLVDQLRLEGPEEALGEGIVVTVTGPTHGAVDPVRGEHSLIGSSRVLAAAIGVMNELPG
jgi:thermitase